MKFKINSIASGEDIYLHKITVSGERSAECYLHICRKIKKGDILQKLYYYVRNFCNLIGLEQWYFRLI